jgi:hypothetical protein
MIRKLLVTKVPKKAMKKDKTRARVRILQPSKASGRLIVLGFGGGRGYLRRRK